MNRLELSYTVKMVKYLLAGVAFTIVSATTVLAQMTPPGPVATPDGRRAARGHPKYEPSPAGVPGARAEPALVAPAEGIATDMPPTEALFDAINRGDTVAAREAIGRGADIHGRNVLGLTALEQSVDLGRNEISFLLLSLRGGAGFSAASRDTAGVEKSSPAAARAQRQAEALATAKARRQQLAEDRASPRVPATPAAPRNAHLFAGDGGAPVPQAGFLGFDSAR